MTDKLSASALDELKALTAKATAGPWESTAGVVWCVTVEAVTVSVCCNRPTSSGECCGNAEPGQDWQQSQDKVADCSPDDAPFIAACRAAVPSLVAEVEQARAQTCETCRSVAVPFEPDNATKQHYCTAMEMRVPKVVDGQPFGCRAHQPREATTS
jgi:hypothetical protein